MLLPALARAKQKAKLAGCQNNFHQIFVACAVYANDYHDYYPIDTTHFATPNELKGEHYTYFVISPDQTTYGANAVIKQGIQSTVFDNLGYLFETHGIGDGKALFCPSFPDSSTLSANSYANPQFMSTGSDSRCRDTMLFNPRVMKAQGLANMYRAFPKTSSVWNGTNSGGSHLFGTDYLGGGPSDFKPDTFAHYPSKAFNCVFTDGSVRFVRSPSTFKLITNEPGAGGPLVTDETAPSAEQYDKIFNWLENED
jgi:hypothetical protein